MARERTYPALEKRFGSVLRQLREQAGLTQEQLAFKSDIHRTYVSQLERGIKTPTIRLLWQVSGALSTTPAEILRAVAATVPLEAEEQE